MKLKYINITAALCCCLFLSAGITGCSKDKNSTNTSGIKPTGPKPDWGPDIHDEMLVVIEKMEGLGGKPIETLSAQEARQQPTAADAVKGVMADYGIAAPALASDTVGKDIPVVGGTIHARVYTPRTGTAPYPVIVYFHGGGWVIADLNTYDASARALCEKTNAIVVSVHYRQGPEYKFPTAHNDSYAAYKWAIVNAASINGNSAKIAVAGESAGGNLACNVSIMARDSGIAMPVHQLLIYPVASNYTSSPSYMTYASAKPLNKSMINWFLGNFLPDLSATADARISLVNAKLNNLPATTIINAEIDPLQDDGAALNDKLTSSGVTVERKLYSGVTHEFFGMATVVPEAADAQNYAADRLKNAFK